MAVFALLYSQKEELKGPFYYQLFSLILLPVIILLYSEASFIRDAFIQKHRDLDVFFSGTKKINIFFPRIMSDNTDSIQTNVLPEKSKGQANNYHQQYIVTNFSLTYASFFCVCVFFVPH